jgi:UDP-N-acetylglucosamine--N-acetylmuramyl-(pentapeptide) pyrophosphoryl-undecaprenol N-acetylglucosamine transferase
VGTGGGPGVAPLLAACARRVPLLLLEPNVVAGRANRLLARFATAVLSQHAETVASLPRGVRLETSGTPLREDLECGLSKSQARARFGLDPAVRTILVTGGSQGAESLNEKFAAAAVALGASAVPMQVLHVTGDGKDPGYARRLESAGVRARVLPFVEDMPVAYRAADLVASRSGGSTLAEIAALALPSVLAPFPWHRDRHQERNAEIFVRAGASRMFFDARESAERLAAILSELLGDGGAALRPMEAAAAALGRPSATRDAVRLAIVLAESRAAVAASSRGTPAFAGGGGR